MALVLDLWVPGRPRSKGSMKCLGGKSHNMVEQVSESKPWRQKMQRAIVREISVRMSRPGHDAAAWRPIEAPLSVRLVFVYERPKTGMGTSLPYPTLAAGANAAGDIDKLSRNVLDALQGAGLIKDDAQVVELRARKGWGERAGVLMQVETVEDL